MEFKFVAPALNGSQAKFILNDVNIWYLSLRSILSEEVCIEAIEHVKKRSGKKCAITFGNCQTIRLRETLLNNMQFRREYFLLVLPAVFEYSEFIAKALYGGWTVSSR